MSRQIRQTIEQLIPRHTGELPPELVDLTSSLLAQSYSKLSNLSAEEDSSRTYICAHLACERLKTTLNLTKIEPRPPLPQKTYKKLYGYFDRDLAAPSSRRHRQNATDTPDRKLPQRHTPSKEISFQGFKTSRAPKSGLKFGNTKKDSQLPKWVGPALRFLCKETGLGYESAVVHVYAGVESIMFLQCPEVEKWDEGKNMKGKVPALIIAVMMYVKAGMSGRPLHRFDYSGERRMLVPFLKDVRENTAMVKKVGNGEKSWEGWEDVTLADIKGWGDEIGGRGWLDMEWYKNAVDDTGRTGPLVDNDIEDEDDLEEVIPGEESLEERKKRIARDPGLGRMNNEEYDYFSEEKQRDFARWKKLILVKIDELVADDPMELE